MSQPAATVIIPSQMMTLLTLRFFTAALRSGPALGPTSAAEGPMKPTNRNAEPTHSDPETMCRNRRTSMTGSAASMVPLLSRRREPNRAMIPAPRALRSSRDPFRVPHTRPVVIPPDERRWLDPGSDRPIPWT